MRNINLTIKKGETIGIIGDSGSGKTSLVNLLLRFLKEQEGQIEVDGKPLTDEKIDSWRSIIGYVQQDFYMLDTYLAENIAFGVDKSDIDIEKLKKCIKQASIKEFVNNLDDGIYTQIGEFGSKLSGGQRQRIAIARALYKDPQILLFDEATSSLDSTTESEIINTIHELSAQNITMLIISHRISSLRYCDKIYELKNGEITKAYSYKEILGKDINYST